MLPSDYNVAPTTSQPIVRLNRDTGKREMVMMRWELIPYSAKSASEFKHDRYKSGDGLGESPMRGPFQKWSPSHSRASGMPGRTLPRRVASDLFGHYDFCK